MSPANPLVLSMSLPLYFSVFLSLCLSVSLSAVSYRLCLSLGWSNTFSLFTLFFKHWNLWMLRAVILTATHLMVKISFSFTIIVWQEYHAVGTAVLVSRFMIYFEIKFLSTCTKEKPGCLPYSCHYVLHPSFTW